MKYICYNGHIISSEQPVVGVSNELFKYGYGLFETMKFTEGKIKLADLHFERLFTGLQLLQIDHAHITSDGLMIFIRKLTEANNCSELAKIRLTAFPDDDRKMNFTIEATSLDTKLNDWSYEGWKIDLYPYAKKATDAFANLKSANFLPYIMAANYAKENNFHECLVLNHQNQIADGSKTNVFLIVNDDLLTPALHQGCVNGVMRRYLIDELKKAGMVVKQTEITEEHLYKAEELFLTNAVQGIKWVKSFRDKEYPFEKTREIYELVKSL